MRYFLTMLVALFAPVALAQGFDLTGDGLKELLGTPLMLFGVMLLASLGSAMKQVVSAKQQGAAFNLSSYLFEYWPQTVASVIGNVLAFATLVMTDQLNLASAIGIGYGVNSLVDVFRPGEGSRASAIAAQVKGNG